MEQIVLNFISFHWSVTSLTFDTCNSDVLSMVEVHEIQVVNTYPFNRFRLTGICLTLGPNLLLYTIFEFAHHRMLYCTQGGGASALSNIFMTVHTNIQ
jgi:hypothetical protein